MCESLTVPYQAVNCFYPIYCYSKWYTSISTFFFILHYILRCFAHWVAFLFDYQAERWVIKVIIQVENLAQTVRISAISIANLKLNVYVVRATSLWFTIHNDQLILRLLA